MINIYYLILFQNIIDQNNNSDEESLDKWINWICKIEGHELFAEVDEDFIQDTFNLYRIKQLMPRYDDALQMILSSDISDSDDLAIQK